MRVCARARVRVCIWNSPRKKILRLINTPTIYVCITAYHYSSTHALKHNTVVSLKSLKNIIWQPFTGKLAANKQLPPRTVVPSAASEATADDDTDRGQKCGLQATKA